MNINKISFNAPQNYRQTKPQYIRNFGNNFDTVEFTTKKAIESPKNKLIKDLNNIKFLESIFINPENKLGEGFSHKVYSIPNNDNYVLRVSSNFDPSAIDFSSLSIRDTEDKNLNINIGQDVADLIFNRKDTDYMPERVSILKKQTGKSVGVAPWQTMVYPDTNILRPGQTNYESVENKTKYASSLKALAKMPVSAYENFLNNITEAAKHGYSFDYLNSNNILYDEESQSLNLIDMEKGGNYLNYANVLYALTNISYYNTYVSRFENPVSDEEINQVTQDTITIIDKYLHALKNENLKINRNDCAIETIQLFSSFPMKIYCNNFDMNAVWKKLESMGVLIKK